MRINWTEEMSVYDIELDEHHRHLISLINKLGEALESKEEKDIVSEILDELADYVNYHFGAEEALFEIRNYPDAALHIEEHMVFRKDLKDLNDRFLSGDDTAGKQLMDYLVSWWRNHILTVDKKYAPYVKR